MRLVELVAPSVGMELTGRFQYSPLRLPPAVVSGGRTELFVGTLICACKQVATLRADTIMRSFEDIRLGCSSLENGALAHADALGAVLEACEVSRRTRSRSTWQQKSCCSEIPHPTPVRLPTGGRPEAEASVPGP